LEDYARGSLTGFPITYAFIGGVAVVIFWRGVWHTADMLMQLGGVWSFFFYEPMTVVWSTAILLLTGLFVSFFIGDRIFLSGLRHEKKIFEKTVLEVAEEEGELVSVMHHVKTIERELAALTEKISLLEKRENQAEYSEVER